MNDPNRAAEKAAKLAAKQAAHQQTIEGLEFKEWPKIGRLNRDVVITEKIDGTNAAIGIIPTSPTGYRVYAQSRSRIITPGDDNYGFAAWVQRHADLLARTLGPGLHFGEWWGVGIARGYGMSERRFSLFNTAKWGTGEGATALVLARSEGAAIYAVPVLYNGPWTGVFGYVDAAATAEKGENVWLALQEQQDWPEVSSEQAIINEDIEHMYEKIEQYTGKNLRGLVDVPGRRYLTVNPRPRFAPNFILEFLKRVGSQAAPGFMKPEGVVVYQRAGNVCMKATIEGDAEWKGKRDVLAPLG